MAEKKFDLAIVGGGPGGYVAAIRASQLGLKTVVIEANHLGGICLNWGCIPTKALLKSANVFEYIEHAGDYGIEVASPKADFGGMVERSRGVADGMSKGVTFLMKKNNIDVHQGVGSFVDAHTVAVTPAKGNATNIGAKHVIVATGSPGSISIRISLDSGRSSSADCTSSVILHVPDTVGVNRTSYSPSPLSVTTHGSPKSALGCPIGGQTYAVSSAPP